MYKKLIYLIPFILVLVLVSSASATLPQGWQSQDIGTTGGSATENCGTWFINADGADIWGNSDEFHFAYVPLTGDGEIVARVIDNGIGSNGWAKGGVMIRETLEADSKHTIMALTGGEGGGMAFQNRPETGGSSFSSHGNPAAAPPYWVKLTRVGNTFTGYSSADGVTWEQQPDGTGGDATTNPVEIEMAADVYIGLFVTSHASGEVRTYTFDNVSTELSRAMDNWKTVVSSAEPGFLATNVKDGLYDIGEFSGDITYEFCVRSNPDETEASMCLIGRRDFGETQVGLKYEQWNNTGTYGATVFGVVDLDYGVPTSPGENTHLVFVSSEDTGTTLLYVNGVLEGSVDSAITLSGLVGIGYGARGEDGSGSFDNFDGDIFGVAIYDMALSDEQIAAHLDAFFTPLSDVTTPGDIIQGIPDDGDWPSNEAPPLAIDNNVETKYLHFKGDFVPDPNTGGTGFQVTPSAGPSIVTGLTFTTANDVPGRDPVAFEFYGSNESIDGPYELIAAGDIVDFAQEFEWPRFTKNETPIMFDNDLPYNHYQLIFTAIRGPVGGSVNSMQIAEVELIGIVLTPCIEKTGAVPATDSNIIEQFPVLAAVDNEGDLGILNPLNAYFQDDSRELFGLEDFGGLYRDYDIALIPDTFDVRAVNIFDTGEAWQFAVNMFGVGTGDSRFQPLVSSGQARVAIYVDTDIDSIYDVILTTVVTDDGSVRMVAVNCEYQRLASEMDIAVQWDEAARELFIEVPAQIVGQHYQWILVTGFAVSVDASCAAVSDPSIRWAPIVDIVRPDCPTCPPSEERAINFYDSFQSSSQCQIWKSTATDCPTPNQPLVNLPGPITPSGKQGWLVLSIECGKRKFRIYCSGDFIGWVDNGIKAGWFARCPYGGGENSTAPIHLDSDGIPDGWAHTVKKPSSTTKVEYIYKFGPPYTYWIKLYSGTNVNTCKNLQLTNNPWALPTSLCSYPSP